MIFSQMFALIVNFIFPFFRSSLNQQQILLLAATIKTIKLQNDELRRFVYISYFVSNCFHRYLFNFLAVVALFVWQLTSFTLAFTYIHTFMLTSHHFFRCFPFYGAKKHYFVYDSTHTQTDSPYALLLRARLQWKWTNLHTLFYALHWVGLLLWAELSRAAVQCSCSGEYMHVKTADVLWFLCWWSLLNAGYLHE